MISKKTSTSGSSDTGSASSEESSSDSESESDCKSDSVSGKSRSAISCKVKYIIWKKPYKIRKAVSNRL